MNVLMFGWEYPPHIAGGLGTACEGLTRSLAELGVALTFVVPRAFGDEDAQHMHLLGAGHSAADSPSPQDKRIAAPAQARFTLREETRIEPGILTLVVDAILSPYERPRMATRPDKATIHKRTVHERVEEPFAPDVAASTAGEAQAAAAQGHYGGDLFSEVRRLARSAATIARQAPHDVIHGHDWMTWPATIEARRVSGKPAVLHVHSLEYDRSGEHVNEVINNIERAALQSADHIVCVSHYTKSLVVRMHDIDSGRISVVHNGVSRHEAEEQYHLVPDTQHKMVLFMGRITFQKGPEYFVRAAARVVERMPQARFVMAGSGDMVEPMRALTKDLGLEEYFEFPGFLRGPQRERYFSLADVYVMPSVSEPFGITPLEAMAYDVPVIISRQSGVSEVLRHALKVDFWDVERTAELLLSLLRHDALSTEITRMAQRELLHLHWRAAAQKLIDVYRQLGSAN